MNGIVPPKKPKAILNEIDTHVYLIFLENISLIRPGIMAAFNAVMVDSIKNTNVIVNEPPLRRNL